MPPKHGIKPGCLGPPTLRIAAIAGAAHRQSSPPPNESVDHRDDRLGQRFTALMRDGSENPELGRVSCSPRKCRHPTKASGPLPVSTNTRTRSRRPRRRRIRASRVAAFRRQLSGDSPDGRRRGVVDRNRGGHRPLGVVSGNGNFPSGESHRASVAVKPRGRYPNVSTRCRFAGCTQHRGGPAGVARGRRCRP